MTDKSGKLADDTTPLKVAEDTNAAGKIDLPSEHYQSFGSVLLDSATGKEDVDERSPDADEGTTDNSQA